MVCAGMLLMLLFQGTAEDQKLTISVEFFGDISENKSVVELQFSDKSIRYNVLCKNSECNITNSDAENEPTKIVRAVEKYIKVGNFVPEDLAIKLISCGEKDFKSLLMEGYEIETDFILSKRIFRAVIKKITRADIISEQQYATINSNTNDINTKKISTDNIPLTTNILLLIFAAIFLFIIYLVYPLILLKTNNYKWPVVKYLTTANVCTENTKNATMSDLIIYWISSYQRCLNNNGKIRKLLSFKQSNADLHKRKKEIIDEIESTFNKITLIHTKNDIVSTKFEILFKTFIGKFTSNTQTNTNTQTDHAITDKVQADYTIIDKVQTDYTITDKVQTDYTIIDKVPTDYTIIDKVQTDNNTQIGLLNQILNLIETNLNNIKTQPSDSNHFKNEKDIINSDMGLRTTRYTNGTNEDQLNKIENNIKRICDYIETLTKAQNKRDPATSHNDTSSIIKKSINESLSVLQHDFQNFKNLIDFTSTRLFQLLSNAQKPALDIEKSFHYEYDLNLDRWRQGFRDLRKELHKKETAAESICKFVINNSKFRELLDLIDSGKALEKLVIEADKKNAKGVLLCWEEEVQCVSLDVLPIQTYIFRNLLCELFQEDSAHPIHEITALLEELFRFISRCAQAVGIHFHQIPPNADFKVTHDFMERSNVSIIAQRLILMEQTDALLLFHKWLQKKAVGGLTDYNLVVFVQSLGYESDAPLNKSAKSHVTTYFDLKETYKIGSQNG